MKFNIDMGIEIRCKDCVHFEHCDKNYGKCKIKPGNEVDDLGLRYRHRKACTKFMSIDKGMSVRQVLLEQFGDKVIEQVQRELLQEANIGVVQVGNTKMLQAEYVPIVVQEAVKKVLQGFT